MRRSIVLAIMSTAGIMFSVFIVPIMQNETGMGGSLCPLVANAQTNPCLAQDATISAQEVAILRLQATNTVLDPDRTQSEHFPKV